MNEKIFTLYLESISKTLPSSSCLVIGSGNGRYIEILKASGFEKVVLIEADEKQIEKMYKMHDMPPYYKTEKALIHKDEVDVNFYKTTNPSVNCIKSPKNYKKLMPNVSIKKIEVMQSHSLDTFLESKNLQDINWLIIDTYTAPEILEYAEHTLESLDVLVCRTTKETQNVLSVFMSEKGFLCIECFKERNPKIRICLYAKDYKKKIQTVEQALSQKLQEKNNLINTLKETSQKEKHALSQQFEIEKEKVSELVKKRDTLTNELKAKSTLLEESDKLVASFLESESTTLPKAYLDRCSHDEKIDTITSFCMKQNDILLAIDNFVLCDDFSEFEKFDLCCSFAKKVAQSGDKHQGVSYVNNARFFLADDEKSKGQYKKLIELASSLNAVSVAVDLEMEFNEKYGLFSEQTNKKIAQEYKNIRAVSQKKQAHGHDLLIDYIEKNVKDNDESKKVLVEIGTTRENIPGQGSTMQLAKLCKRKNIRFITVDMDDHNGRWASFVSQKLGLSIEVVTKKGEDYLRDDIDAFDFVFLDAYDFDHGMHSELRQSRYEANLGSKIDEEACHLMHLDCAKSVVKKLKKDGVVCVDDTWKDENGEWTAKGTLAVPYLVENKFVNIENRNRATLMRRK